MRAVLESGPPAVLAPPAPLSTTGVGSLPHTQLELALQLAFQVDIPYLPQLPRRNPAEFMVAQALEGLPGLRTDGDGNCELSLFAWNREGAALAARLERALSGREPVALAAFEPTPEGASAYREFLWEVRVRNLSCAKVQLAGPLTVTHALRLPDGRAAASDPVLGSLLFKLVLARALAMVRAVRQTGAQPIFVFDEPGLCGLDLASPRHLLGLQDLKLSAAVLRKEGALVGLHCCGNTDWPVLLRLGFDLLSIDARLSLDAMLAEREAFAEFEAGGGRLILGVVPTDLTENVPTSTRLQEDLLALLRVHGAERLLHSSFLSPACGLALRGVVDAEATFETLSRLKRALKAQSFVA